MNEALSEMAKIAAYTETAVQFDMDLDLGSKILSFFLFLAQA